MSTVRIERAIQQTPSAAYVQKSWVVPEYKLLELKGRVLLSCSIGAEPPLEYSLATGWCTEARRPFRICPDDIDRIRSEAAQAELMVKPGVRRFKPRNPGSRRERKMDEKVHALPGIVLK